ncbi:metal-binding protein (plasmid) [Psychrobacillus glaciei]|uniref:Metal-binding protein n=2 Tax=Psychrobacillus glaciei TaxID=2283160 RepID=A0A5J6ST97_9BACI|nr:Ada metal-binding domain-containing protein [Psychrobacillus glaciei]QFG01302.1 metal-binding protein [Psychrobacillus glaciei]
MKTYKLLNSVGDTYSSETPGLLGGHRKLKIYGRLDCSSALSFIQKGHYVKYRVFFADEKTAISAGYRPCARCMKEAYQLWKSSHTIV